MRTVFDEQLKELNRAMISTGALCEQSIACAVEALTTGDKSLTKKNGELAEQITHQERDIEAMCIKLLMKQQPVAADLRFISAALKMVTDLERIGHQTSDMAEIIAVCNIPEGTDCSMLHDMAVSVIKMVNDSIEAFLHSDVELARSVIQYDDIVDNYFTEIRKSLVEMLKIDPDSSEYVMDLHMISKYLERIGDHAVNVAGWVIYSVTGIRETDV